LRRGRGRRLVTRSTARSRSKIQYAATANVKKTPTSPSSAFSPTDTDRRTTLPDDGSWCSRRERSESARSFRLPPLFTWADLAVSSACCTWVVIVGTTYERNAAITARMAR
jgi:hypothetical protein